MKLLMIMSITAMLAFSLNVADLAGTWKGSMETQMGTTPVTIVFTPGAVLAGTANLGDFKGAIQDGQLDGNNISFQVKIEHGVLGFEGTVAGNEMRFNVTGTQGDKYPLICTRQK